MDWAHLVLLILLGSVSFVAGLGWRNYRIAARRLESNPPQALAATVPRWEPRFVTPSYGTSLEIKLVRVHRRARMTDQQLNSLTIGEVDTAEPGWEKKLDDLVISARARMAELNAFIDSYTGTVS